MERAASGSRGEDERRDRRPRAAGPPAGRRARRGREPQLSRQRRPRGVVAATTGLLGLSSTKRAAILAVVVCAIALTVAVPLRNYVTQRQELAAVTAQQEQLAAEVERLTRERGRLADPAEIIAQARSRLGFAAPGEVPYVVQLPADAAAAPEPGEQVLDGPWYRSLWRELGDGPMPR